jgi:hypothetical protein
MRHNGDKVALEVWPFWRVLDQFGPLSSRRSNALTLSGSGS